MRHQSASEQTATDTALQALTDEYNDERSRVHTTCRRLRDVIAAREGPAGVRAAAMDLTHAIRDAKAVVVRTLRQLQEEAPPQRRSRRRRKATRVMPADVAAWSSELLRLTEIGEWLRIETLDQPGVHVPATADSPTASAECEPRVGVDLRAIIDGYRNSRKDNHLAQAGVS